MNVAGIAIGLLIVLCLWLLIRVSQLKKAQNGRVVEAWFDKTQPLGLPPGTVRAILVLMAMVGILYPVFQLVTWQGTLDPAVKDVLLVLLGALPGLVKDYIAMRNVQTGNGDGG